MITQFLDDLESRINPKTEQKLQEDWTDFFTHGTGNGLFKPQRQTRSASEIEWPDISINDTLNDNEKMALHQYEVCSRQIASGNGGPMNVRSNFGTGILSSLFGAELFIMPEETNTLPTTRILKDGVSDIRKLVDAGVPDLNNGLGRQVFDMGEYYKDILKNYPRIQEFVQVYHPDLQGPLDICELLWGSEMFLVMHDEPELVHAMLNLITETYIQFLRKWFALFPPRPEINAHWNMMYRGPVMLRNDSAMNLSPEMYAEFALPYDQRIFDTFGGGGIHFCGRGDHYIERMCSMKGLTTIQLSQPDYNDMEKIYRNTVDKGIRLIGLQREESERAEKARGLNGFVHSR